MSGQAKASTIPGRAAAAAAAYADTEAIVDGDDRLGFAALVDESRRFAAALVASGTTPGSRVAIWAFNSVQWVVAALGTWQAGAVLVPINTRFKGQEAADILARSRAQTLVTVTDFLGVNYLDMLRTARAVLPDLTTTVVAVGPVPTGVHDWDRFLGHGTPDAAAEVDRRCEALGPEDPSDILFTSGTTGVPKGVVQSHGHTLRVADDWVAMTGLHAGDRYLMVNPYFHMFGLKAGILACMVAGATMLPEPVFDVARVMHRVSAERVTVLPGPPTLYQAILDYPTRAEHDLSSLRVAVTGAADIPVDLVRRALRELPFSLIVTGYGLTEAGTALSTSPDDDVETIATTVGRPRPGFELRVVDDKDHDVPPGQTGEILLRGASVMSEYLDDPTATAAVFAPGGWLRTGDIGVVDESGCLRIVGRSKDMFIVGGFNVYPAEIENYLLEHDAVAQAAVIGVPDERLGEVGMAFVVPRPDAHVTGSEIVTWARGRMANYKAPRVVEVIDELPMTATGKVHKAALRVLAVGRPGWPG
jgi:acyl-CoA synthetase (AMP-forming)/AMP-acid ligase II